MNESADQVLVCVTRQKACEQLIRAGAQLAREGEKGLMVVHVAPFGENILGNPQEGEALDYLFTIAKQYGAAMQMLRSEDVAGTLAEYAREHAVGCMVLGSSGKPWSMLRELKQQLPQVDFHMEEYKG